MRLEFSSRAESDLEAIMDYLAQEAGPETALRYGQKIREECCKVCAAPGMGKRHPIHFRIRKIIVGPHKIFYREDPGASLFTASGMGGADQSETAFFAINGAGVLG